MPPLTDEDIQLGRDRWNRMVQREEEQLRRDVRKADREAEDRRAGLHVVRDGES